jgi:uncharacterized damage-inducible protein DinB
MHTSATLLDIQERTHRNLKGLLEHCRSLSAEELDRELPGFAYPTVRLQIHHVLGGEQYWVGVLRGLMRVEDDDPDYPTVASLEAYLETVDAATRDYLRGASPDELNTPRAMRTWTPGGTRERVLTPAMIILRTQTHLYTHLGQVVAMCRLMGKPAKGLDFPID